MRRTPVLFLNTAVHFSSVVLHHFSLKHVDASYESRYMCSLLLEPRSLLVLQNDMYTRYQIRYSFSVHVHCKVVYVLLHHICHALLLCV